MKATIEIPDELYRKVKARSALLGRTVREVTTELYQRWLGDAPISEPAPTSSWIDEWVTLGEASLHEGSPGETARQLLHADRNRGGETR
jgi:hypothetical protein